MDAVAYGTGKAGHPAGVRLRAGLYANSRPAFHLVCAENGTISGSLTVNVPHLDLPCDQIVVASDWNTPADVKAELLESGKFAPVLPPNIGSQASCEVWCINAPELLAELDDLQARARLREERPQAVLA